jgi:ABC-2 type transport system permease protein
MTTTLVPLVGILIGYGAVVSERESGELLLSLALPHSRRDLILGALVSRSALMVGTTVAALAGAGFLVVYPFGELVVGPYLWFTVSTTAFGLVWSNLGIAASVAVSTERRALALVFGLVILFVVAWDTLTGALRALLAAAGLVDGGLPGPVRFLVELEPGHVFGRVIAGFVDPTATVEGPWYLSEWVALLLFVLWTVGPLGLAYVRFGRSDLA